MTYDEALKALRRLEGEREMVPCPDGIKGCCVAHFKSSPGPIERAIVAHVQAEAQDAVLSAW